MAACLTVSTWKSWVRVEEGFRPVVSVFHCLHSVGWGCVHPERRFLGSFLKSGDGFERCLMLRLTLYLSPPNENLICYFISNTFTWDTPRHFNRTENYKLTCILLACSCNHATLSFSFLWQRCSRLCVEVELLFWKGSQRHSFGSEVFLNFYNICSQSIVLSLLALYFVEWQAFPKRVTSSLSIQIF